jgi:hypothetical protein
MQQVLNIEDVFREYFKVGILPDRIIELGTAWGNFTHILHKVRSDINYDFDFITIDKVSIIEDMPWNMIFCQMSIFDNVKFIAELIKPNTLLLCDDGDKPLEVRTFTPYLKKGCVIMAHDYKTEYWWNSEIIFDDIKDLGLVPYHQDIMDKGGWLSLKLNI